MEISADVGEHGLDSVMLIAELDVNAAMNAPVSHEDTAVPLIKRMKHAFEVPRLLYDPGLASAMRTTPLNYNVVVKSAFRCLRFWCSSTRQMREYDDFCRYMTQRHLSKYVSSTRSNSCDSFSGSSLPLSATSSRRTLLPTLTVAATRRSVATMLPPRLKFQQLDPEFADAEPLEEAGASSSSPHVSWARVVAGRS
eukprot:6213559-Pleurochrysis_carterae.AAC.2